MSKVKMFSQTTEPLTPAVFYILLSLAVKERHGYSIMKDVSSSSQGKIKLGPGTLYGNIKRLLEEGLIQETRGDERRKYYKLTDKGRMTMNTELQRFEEALMIARKAKLNLNLKLALI